MIIINLLGLLLIGLIIWWFWLYKPPVIALEQNNLVVIVENGTYQPGRIKLPANQPTTIQFLRKDESPCAEMVLLPDLEISESLPLNKPKNIELPPLKTGEYPFHCQMQMYRGVLKVERA